MVLFQIHIIFSLFLCTLQYMSSINDQTRYTTLVSWDQVNQAQGIFTKLCPLGAKFYLYQEASVNIYFFLHTAYDGTGQLFYLHYVEISVDQDQIIHHVLFQYEGSWQWRQFAFDKFNYEGQWFHQYVYFDEKKKQIVVGMIWKNNILKEFTTPYQEFKIMETTNYYGGDVQDIHPVTNILMHFQQFPGSMSGSIDTLLENVYDLTNLGLDIFECSTDVSLQTDLIEFSANSYKLFMIEKTNQQFYKLQFWAKVNDQYDPFIDQTVHMLRIAANRFISSFDATGSNSFILDYIYNQYLQQWYMDIRYSSYLMPIIMQFVDGFDPLEHHEQIIIDDFQSISNWHLISVTYNPNQLTFDIKGNNQKFSKIYQNVYQFSYIYYRLFLGGWINSQSTLDRSFALIYFYDCPNNIDITCHYSCGTCSGPLANHCLTCSAKSNRQYNLEQHTCNCQLWYTEISNTCQFATYSDSRIELIKDDQYDTNQCQFGYFIYEQQCYKCPSASQNNQIACTECLMRPNDWIYKKAICQNLYYQNQDDPQSAYVKFIDNNVQYLFSNGDLITCNGCQICWDDQSQPCFLSSYRHLDQPTYIKCQSGYQAMNGECQRIKSNLLTQQVCLNYCQKCNEQKCQICIDQQLYFLDLSGQCQICQIAHCKYCFQYNKFNLLQNSIFQNDQQLFEDDYQVGCILCEQYYYFSFELNLCIRNTLSDDCEYYIDTNGSLQCYATTLNLQTSKFQEIKSCQNYMANCQNCVRNYLGILFCIKCDEGYYVNNENGLCFSCVETLTSDVTDCYSQSSNLEGYKLQFAGLLQYFDAEYQDFNGLINSLTNIVISQCTDGMILNQQTNNCIPSCTDCNQCKFQNNQLQCQKCDASNDEINFYSQMDGSCYKCPYPCKFCLPMDEDQIFEYNPYFIYSGQQAYKCLKNYDDSATYIDSKSGLLKPLNITPQLFRLTLLGTASSTTFSDYSYLISKSVQQFLNTKIDAVYTPMSQVYSLNNYTILLVNYLHELNYGIAYSYLYNITELLAFNNTFKTFNSMFQIASTYGIKVTIHNMTLNQSMNNNIFRFYSAKAMKLSKITVRNTTLKASKVISVNNFYEPSVINIINILFRNSSFTDTKFFSFEEGVNHRFQILNVTFINCTFTNSNFITQNSDAINLEYSIKNVTLINCTVINSVLIFIPQTVELKISQIYVQDTKFLNSTILQSKSSLVMSDCTLNSSNLTNSVLFNLQFSETNSLISISNVTGLTLILQSSIVISINPSQQSISCQAIIYLVQLQDILQLPTQVGQNDNSFIYLIDASVTLTDVVIQLRAMLYFFSCEDCYIIQLSNIYVKQNQRQQYISQLNDDVLNYQHTLIIITNFQRFEAQDIQLIDLTAITSSLISIRSDNSDAQQVIFRGIYLTSYISFCLIKSVSSAINIQVDNQCIIQISDSAFTNSRFFYNVSNQDIPTASLLKIKSSQSYILLHNLIFYNNSNYNSSESLIYLVATTIVLTNINASFINQQSSSQLESLCGFGVLEGEFINITNSWFYNIFSAYYGVFYIQSQFSGIIGMKNNTFNNSDLKVVQKGGVFTLDGSQSSIYLWLQDQIIENIYSQLLGAFIYFLPSQISNKVILDQIHLKNVHSIDNSFAQFEFSNSTASNNFVKVSNIVVNNSLKSYYSLIYTDDTINSINSSQLSGYLTSSYSNFTLFNFTYIGDLTQPLLSLMSMNKVIVQQLKLINITFGFSFSYFVQLTNYETAILKDLVIQNVSTNYNQQNYFSLSTSSNNQMLFQNLLIQNTQCKNCQNGLINFISTLFQKIQCFNFVFYSNDCGIRSCIVSNNNQISIANSVMIDNKVSQYAVFYIELGNIALKNVIFKNNIAEGYGGAIYFYDCSIQLKNVFIINNTALTGGGIYYDSGRLERNQILQLYLFENNGTKGVNNIREQPDFLKLQTYGILLRNKQSNISQYTIETPEYIVNYKQLRINSSFITASSGYSVQDSEIFNFSTMSYIKTNISLQINQFNQLGELVIDTLTNKCFIQQFFVNEKLNNTFLDLLNNNLNENQTTIQFNETIHSYPLDDLTVYLDPYLNSSFYMLIDCQCNSFLDNNYRFQFKVKTQTCGLGEYYQNSLCLKCDYDKGYYSVEKNSLECQRMDPKQIKSVTQSSLELQPGYWRIDYYSSNIDQCQFYSQFCLGGWNVNYNSCSVGYIGALCEECDIYNVRGDAEYIKSLQGYCYMKKVNSETLVTLIIVMLILFFIAYLISKIQGSMQENFKKLKLKSLYYKILFKYSVDLMKALIKQAIFLLQILYVLFPPTQILIGEYSQVIWPLGNPSKIVMHLMELLADKISVDIIYATAIGSILLPLIQILLLTIIFVSYQRRMQSVNNYISNIQTVSLFFVCYSMPNICEQLASLISSRSIANISWVGSNVSYQFYTDEHQQWLTYFILPAAIIVLIILPLSVFQALLYEIKNNKDQAKGFSGYLITYYNQKYYYWELITLEMILIVTFLNSYLKSVSIIFKDLFLIFILFIYYAGISYTKPYVFKKLNQIEKVGIAFDCFIASLSCIQYQASSENLIEVQYLMAAMMVCLLIALLGYVLANILIGYYNKYDETFDQVRIRIKQRFPELESQCPMLKGLLKSKTETRKRVQHRFQYMKVQIRIMKLNNSRSMRSALNFMNDEPHGVILSNILRQENRQLIISSPLQQSILM